MSSSAFNLIKIRPIENNRFYMFREVEITSKLIFLNFENPFWERYPMMLFLRET